MADTILIWRPEPLTARLLAMQVPARQEFAAAAVARAPSNKVRPGIRVIGEDIAVPPLGAIIEKGSPAHDIQPKGKVLKLKDGGFVTGPVRHPGMAPKPWIRPLLPLWGSLYRRHAAAVFRGF